MLHRKGCDFYQQTRISKLKRHLLLYWKHRMLTKIIRKQAMSSAQVIHERVVKANVLSILKCYRNRKKESKVINQKAFEYYKMRTIEHTLHSWRKGVEDMKQENKLLDIYQEKQDKRKKMLIWNYWSRRARRDFSNLNRKQALHFRKITRKQLRACFQALDDYASKNRYLREALDHFKKIK